MLQYYILVIDVSEGDNNHLAPRSELLTGKFVARPVLEISVVNVKHDWIQLGRGALDLQKIWINLSGQKHITYYFVLF